MKSCASYMVLVWRTVKHGPVGPIFCFKAINTEPRKKSHEIESIKYGPGIFMKHSPIGSKY